MPKVLIISSEFPPGPGGIGNHAYQLARALNTKGYQVTVLTNPGLAKEAEIAAFDQRLADSIKVVRTRRSGYCTYFHRFQNASPLAKIADSILLTGKFSLWIGAVLKKWVARHKKYIAVLHGTELQLPDTKSRKLTNWALRFPNVLVPVSDFTKGLIPKLKGNKRVTVIPNGIDPEFLKGITPDSALQLVGNPVLLTVGNVNKRKGQHRVIRALPEIIKTFPEAHYHLMGYPSQQPEFEALAESLEVSDYITFHGKVSNEDLVAAYRQTDVFLMLSENQADGDVEGFGIAILEANVFGVPAIGAKDCGIEDAINGSNGTLVDGNNTEEITAALKTILSNRGKFSAQAMTWADKHRWKQLVEAYIDLF